ncbi:MAG: LPS-assembly protein LptD [Balneolaceae bacterium]|nr:LPS-assembly protein LptD [Balneolaceae bacterium]MBO6545804.1 LPS-assembly protein LptD [Balneolaceae bacterium]MBO6647200.1 LPS-assembly protein LptD [Balneolaceae bacterium]
MRDGPVTYIGRYVFSIGLICFFTASALSAQQTSPDSTNSRPQVTPPSNDRTTPPDAVEFQSNDSLIVDFRTGRTATLFGSSKVTHPSGTLTSGEIEMDLELNTVEATASAPEDTLSMPVLTRDSDEIRSNRILFNYKTKKGKFEAARVEVGEGHLIGSKVKNVSETEVFIEDGIYSTCPPDYLYYYIKAKKMKVVDQDEIFFTNARLYILDIPYPLVFPFGYVPSGIDQKQSGLLTPTYIFDAQASRGIGLNNVGWFQYVSDYFTTLVSADIYTSGTFAVQNRNQYRKTDKYNGSINLGYSRDQGLESTDPGFTRQINKSLGIQHSQTISPYASLSANINLRTQDYYRQNSLDIEERANATSNSKASYTYKHPEGLFNLGTSAQLVQNFSNNSTSLTGPNANFSLKTFSPFKGSASGNEPKWYENISIRYNNSLKSDFDYQPIDADSAETTFLDALFDPSAYQEATGDNDHFRFGFQQTAALSIGQLFPSQFINSSASINVNEYWYPTSIRQTFNADSNRIETEKINGFEAARDFSTSFSLSTTIYGLSNRKIGSMEGFRHTFQPRLSLSYRPDFSEEQFGYYRTVQTDTLGNTRQYSIFQNEVFSGPGSGEQRTLSVNIQNIFETKIVKRDTTGEVTEKNLKLIDNLSLSSSYNFAADSLNLSQLTTSFRSSAIDGISIVAGARFSFYQRNESGGTIDRLLIKEEGRLAQIENFNISASTSFRGGNGRLNTFTPIYRRTYDPFNQGIFSTIDPGFGYEPVAPLNSPWSLTLRFRYDWTYRFNQSPRKNATINASNISFNLTPKWRFSTSLGYDFIEEKLTPTQFALNRNLECWDLSFRISPFGENQFYLFRLTVNSSQIQTLFQKLPVLKNLERGSDRPRN